MSLIALRPPPAWRTRVPAPSRLRPVISAIAFVMVVRDKPVTVERRLMPPQPKSNALSATYQRCCASLRVDSTFNQRFSSAESPRLGIPTQRRKLPTFCPVYSVTAPNALARISDLAMVLYRQDKFAERLDFWGADVSEPYYGGSTTQWVNYKPSRFQFTFNGFLKVCVPRVVRITSDVRSPSEMRELDERLVAGDNSSPST